MAQGPHPWPPRGAFWPPPTPPKHSQCGPVEGAGFVPTSPNQPGHLWLPAGLARGHCTTCGPWVMGAGAGAAAHPQPMAGGAGCRWGSFLEVSGKSPARCFGPNCTTMGQDSTAHTGAFLAPCTMHFPVGSFFPRVGWCSPQWPTLDCWGAAGCRPGRFLEVSGKTPAKRLWARLHHNGAG